MRTTCTIAAILVLCSPLGAQGERLIEPDVTDSRRELTVRRSTETFREPGGQLPVVIAKPDGSTTLFDRFTILSKRPENFFAAPGNREEVDFLCDDFEVDQLNRTISCTGLKAAKCGNLVLSGDRAEVRGDVLVVVGDKGKEAVLYRLSSNKFGGAIAELRGMRIEVDLKTWSAAADRGDKKTLTTPPTPRKPVEPKPMRSIFDRQ
jgi:hypothetical protein